MPVTIKDVAKLAGTSTATVSHVLNNTRYVSEETRERVNAAIRELGYVANNNARGLRSSVSHRIGLLVPEVSDYFPVNIIEPIEQVLNRAGYQLILGYTHDSIEQEKKQIELFNHQQIDGLLLFPAIGDHTYLRELDYPIVILDRRAEGFSTDCVLADDENMVFEAVSMLIEAGYTSIGTLNGNPNISTTAVRFQAYGRALLAHGMEVDPRLVKEGFSTYEGGIRMTQELLDEGIARAVFTANIAMTLGSLKCLTQNGVNIPGQFAILGLGDCRWAEVTNPPLSVLRHPNQAIGKKAAEVLLRRLRSPKGAPRDYLIPGEIIKRGSF